MSETTEPTPPTSPEPEAPPTEQEKKDAHERAKRENARRRDPASEAVEPAPPGDQSEPLPPAEPEGGEDASNPGGVARARVRIRRVLAELRGIADGLTESGDFAANLRSRLATAGNELARASGEGTDEGAGPGTV